ATEVQLVFASSDDEAPGLLVEAGSGPARRLEQRTQIGVANRPARKRPWAPALADQFVDIVLCWGGLIHLTVLVLAGVEQQHLCGVDFFKIDCFERVRPGGPY